MADIELEVLSRAIQLRAIDQMITAGIEDRHFFDPAARAVFHTCAEHYSVFRNSLSLDGVKRHHPSYQMVPCSDELAYLIREFKDDRAVKIGTSTILEMHRLIEQAEDPNADGHQEARHEFGERFMEIARRVVAEVPNSRASRYSDMDERIVAIRKQQDADELPGVPTGIVGVDRYVRVVRNSDLVVHCAFSSRGKTQGLVRSAIHAYRCSKDNGLFFSLEMDADEISEMFYAEAARLSRKAIRHRELGEDDYGAYEEAAARVKAAENDIIVVDDVAGSATVDKLAALVERYSAKTVCVDYLSLMDSMRKSSSDWERVKDVSSSLKALARSMRVRVYAAAQNNRDAMLEGPTEGNIAYSSSIFNDCNIMVGYHQTAEWERWGKMQVRLLKNRGSDKGPRGDSGYYECYEHWDRDRMIMEEWTPAHDWLAGMNGKST
jgi:replicative DNA helicase